VAAALLSPIAALDAATTARRMTRHGQKLALPVICCGNATAGGAGKTTVALDLGERLRARGLAPHFLLRGYGGKLKGPARVDLAAHDSRAVGNEASLLAAIAPTWVSAAIARRVAQRRKQPGLRRSSWMMGCRTRHSKNRSRC
jgi:tetraacyldisaccharide 4'-kinase